MIYDYIEKTILRRAVLISTLFLKTENNLNELSDNLDVSPLTIRKDLDSFLEIEQIQRIDIKSGNIHILFNNEISLSKILHIILKESLFLKYLFLDLLDIDVTPTLISTQEFISTSSASNICNKIKRFKQKENLSNNELKTRMIIICLSRYINVKNIISFLNKKYLQQAKEIVVSIINVKEIPNEHIIQIIISIYLFFDRSDLYPINLNYEELININILEKHNKIHNILPNNGLTYKQIKNEELLINIIYDYLYEPDTSNPILNNHLNIKYQLEKNTSISSLRELIFSNLNIEPIILKTKLFYYTIQKFITFQHLGFPLKLNFSCFYITKIKHFNQYISVIHQWNKEASEINEDILFEFFYYLNLMEQYSSIHKFIFIVSPNREHFNILYNILSTLFQSETITIDYQFYNSIEEITEEKRKCNHIIVCDRYIQENECENIIPFSLPNIKNDLMSLFSYLYNLN